MLYKYHFVYLLITLENFCTSTNICLCRSKYLNINHAYPVTMLLDTNYVKKMNDSPDVAIHNTFSHFAAFFIVAVTKRFNVGRSKRRVYVVFIPYNNISLIFTKLIRESMVQDQKYQYLKPYVVRLILNCQK